MHTFYFRHNIPRCIKTWGVSTPLKGEKKHGCLNGLKSKRVTTLYGINYINAQNEDIIKVAIETRIFVQA